MKYDDIIFADRPKSHRPKMKLSKRAKIFAPYAALQIFNEEIMIDEQNLVNQTLDPEIIPDDDFVNNPDLSDARE